MLLPHLIAGLLLVGAHFIQAESAPKTRLFILSGQSNMKHLDPEVTFAPALKETFPSDDIVVKLAESGQLIRRWYRDWQPFDASGTGALTISGAPTFLSSSIYTAGNTTLTLTGTSTALNTLSGTIGNGANITTTSLTKNGSGKWVLTAANTYTGPTTVNAGTLLINGTGASAITVNGGVLGGSGTTGAGVTIGNAGTLAPGNSPGMLNTGDLSLTGTGATLALEISGTGVGAYDQVNVAGAVNLDGNGDLELTLLSFTPAANDLFFFILNDGSDAINGTLFNLAQGSTFTSGGQTWQVSYIGDSATNSFTGGNDLALMAIPEPGTLALAGLGLMLVLSRAARTRPKNQNLS